MKSRRFIVKGRVQGVGFRYFVQRTATDLGLSGWVRNLENGDVEIRAEGNEQALNQLGSAVREGPSMSYVSVCEESPAASEGYEGFRIKR